MVFSPRLRLPSSCSWPAQHRTRSPIRPGRVGRLSLIEGDVTFHDTAARESSPATLNLAGDERCRDLDRAGRARRGADRLDRGPP